MAIDKQLWHEFSRFAVVGGINTICNYGLFLVLLKIIGVHYLVAGACGFTFGAIIGFTLNRKWTFSSNIDYKRGIALYLAIQVICLGVHLSTQMLVTRFLGVSELLSQLAGILITTFLNFILIRCLVFK